MGYLAFTVICYKDSGGGAIWKAGDQYQIHKVLSALDQPEIYLLGVCPSIQPGQSGDCIKPSVNVGSGSSNILLQRAGRDYYNNSPIPGYAPYIYPHPLVSGSASPRSALNNFRVVP
jgi:hypothetical protein